MNFRSIIACLCALLAVWLAWPSRNVHGNPGMETQLGRCETGSGTVVRLYQGNGGATSAYWYTVTTQGGFFARERQVLFAYGSPVIESLSCGADGVRLIAQTRTLAIAESEFAALRSNPRSYWRGGEKALPMQPLTIARYGLAAVLALVSVGLLVFIRHKASPTFEQKNIH